MAVEICIVLQGLKLSPLNIKLNGAVLQGCTNFERVVGLHCPLVKLTIGRAQVILGLRSARSNLLAAPHPCEVSVYFEFFEANLGIIELPDELLHLLGCRRPASLARELKRHFILYVRLHLIVLHNLGLGIAGLQWLPEVDA